jgi:hypothetical protein
VIGPCSGRRHCHSKKDVHGGSDGVADRAACERRLVEYSRTFCGASAAQCEALWHFVRWPLKLRHRREHRRQGRCPRCFQLIAPEIKRRQLPCLPSCLGAASPATPSAQANAPWRS